MEFWSVPLAWQGETVVVMASGPSMNQSIANSVKRAQVPCIAVNNTFKLAPWADMLYAADAKWWTETPKAQEFEGLKVSVRREFDPPMPYLHQLRHSGTQGYDPDPRNLRTGGNSGYQAVHIAAQAGAARILLCGFDMNGGHWHGDHVEPLRNTILDSYKVWIKHFHTLASSLQQRSVEVINCTPGSALDAFPMATLESGLGNTGRAQCSTPLHGALTT